MPRSTTLPALELRCGQSPVLVREFPNGLEHFQAFVGGLIDVINLEPATIAEVDSIYQVKSGTRACIVVNDEGINLELPLNRVASIIAGQPVFGDALLCDVP